MINPVSAIIGAVGGFFGKREERKSMEKQIDGKIAMQKQGGETQVVFNEQEIDAISKRNEGETWKDEYITIIMTMPLVVLFFSVFIGILFSKPELIDAAIKANEAVKDLIPNYQELLAVTITAGLGIRAYKKR
jgi:NADH:ubiquinone oxidoreductase subunit 5 (subunit L)/multisubunit Na+/H+ antiporter MnhA subunit